MSADTPDHLAGGKPANAGDFILERRHRLVAPHLPIAGDTMVDFGCGNGAQTVLFADRFQSITGLDIDQDHVFQFESRFRDLDCSARGIGYDGLEVPLESASVDCVTTFEVLEHVVDESQSLRELYRILKPGGVLAISVPNRWWIFETHGADLPVLPWNRVPLFSWLPKSIHDRWARARIYRRREIIAMLREHGFEVQLSAYITAPMDVVRPARIRDFLRATFFRGDTTALPFMSTAVLVIARKPATAG